MPDAERGILPIHTLKLDAVFAGEEEEEFRLETQEVVEGIDDRKPSSSRDSSTTREEAAVLLVDADAAEVDAARSVGTADAWSASLP